MHWNYLFILMHKVWFFLTSLNLSNDMSHIIANEILVYIMSYSLWYPFPICVLPFLYNYLICKHLGGVANLFRHDMIYILQILVLSANTKKGGLKEHFLNPSWFCRLVDNTSDYLI